MIRLLAPVVLLIPTAAFAHPGLAEAGGLLAGLEHPLTGLDHIAAMIAVGLWAAIKGGRALWVWPAAFVGVMLVGGVLGMTQMLLPFVEPGILASVIVLGLMVAMAIDLPIWPGAAIVGVFALFHGHAHGFEVLGAEVPEAVSYLLGFALVTAALHGVGIAIALQLKLAHRQPLVRVGGVACVIIGLGLTVNVF